MDPTTAAVDPIQVAAAFLGSVLIGLLRKFGVELPKDWIPTTVILLGVGFQFADSYVRGVPFNLGAAVLAASAGIGAREWQDRAKRAASAGLTNVLASIKSEDK